VSGRLAFVGCGSWGSALAVLVARKGIPVVVWDGDSTVLRGIRETRHNPHYVPDLEFPDAVEPCDTLQDCIRQASTVVVALPAAAVRDVCAVAAPLLRDPAVTIVSATKGLEPDTGARVTERIAAALGPGSQERLIALSGPNLAAEVARDMPTATVVAGSSPQRLLDVQRTFSAGVFRVYTSSDVVGVELGGALKNVIALAAGISDGLGFADNTKASLITRGLAEMTRVGVALGARPETFTGLSGLGDLVATCSSRTSRNWRVGYALAQGVPLGRAVEELGMVAEGVPTAQAARVLCRCTGVEMPIADQVHSVLFEAQDPRKAVEGLMGRPLREEARPDPPSATPTSS